MPEPIRLLRRALPLVGIGVLAAVIYDGWIFYSRWSSARDAEHMRHAEEVRRARQTIDTIGGTDFRILNFYAVPRAIRRDSRPESALEFSGQSESAWSPRWQSCIRR
jgi:hypothetical protein